jgi:hypothetical protein
VTVQQFCCSGNQDIMKGSVHGAACTIAAVMAIYNIAAWCFRRERHLGANAVVYTLATGWEVKQTLHHLRKGDGELARLRESYSPSPALPSSQRAG